MMRVLNRACLISNSRRGSALVEASIVFPIVILTAISMLYFMLSLYNEAENVSSLHRALLEESGQRSETWENNGTAGNDKETFAKQYAFTEGGKMLVKYIEGNSDRVIKGGGLIFYRDVKEDFSQERILNEAVFVRWVDTGKKALLR